MTTAPAETMVRMGEQAASASAGDVLACIGLGSCIGLVLLDRTASVAGLAHIMLPEAGPGDPARPGRFADTAVPGLVDRVVGLGARRARLRAVLVGGAQMFAFGSSLDVGARNDAAARAALHLAGIPVRAEATGGTCGRTVRVDVASARVTVREAGGTTFDLLGP